MKRNYHVHLSNKDVLKLNKDLKEGKPFVKIDGLAIHDFGFKIEPVEGYTAPNGFPDCCAFHSSVKKDAEEWFNEFPNCCDTHKQLVDRPWFIKDKYSDIPLKILHAVSFTEHHIAKYIDSENWYKDITCLLYTSPSPRDRTRSRMPSSA